MNVVLYLGKDSKKTHLEVNGVTLATEGDLCRDSNLRAQGVDLWTPASLQQAADTLMNT